MSDRAGSSDSFADESDAPPPSFQPPHPAPLEYYSPPTPAELTRVRGLTIWSIILLLGWLPYVCGIINASTLAVSYNAAVTRAHVGGAVLFLGLGIVFSGVSLAGFARMRHAWGITVAAAVMLIQISIGACIGLAR
jgi:hypothetical protein